MDCSALLNASWAFCGAADEVVKGSRAVRETAWRAFCSPTGFAKPREIFSWFWNLPLDVFESPWDGLFGTFERFASGLWGCMGDVLFLPGFRETRGSLVMDLGLALGRFCEPLGWIVWHASPASVGLHGGRFAPPRVSRNPGKPCHGFGAGLRMFF